MITGFQYTTPFMRILAIESSCDETAVAVLAGQGDDLLLESSLVRSQIDIHQTYGGVVPEVAAREHLAYLFPMITQALIKARISANDLDVIAVTTGPGLAPALRVGVEAAKALAWAWHKPLVPVCHLEGHIYATWLDTLTPPQFPALALIVSGGHTELVLMTAHGSFERLGETIDDAAGEAFDKVAKMLSLPYPGGPQIEQLAKLGNSAAFDFPRAMLDKPNLDFSFAGLKTSVLYTLRKNEEQLADSQFRADIAASFQAAVIDVLMKKTAKAVLAYSPKSIILAGGVAANISLRSCLQRLGAEHGVDVHVPSFAYALDNAAMIAVAGYYRALAQDFVDPLVLSANPNLDIV